MCLWYFNIKSDFALVSSVARVEWLSNYCSYGPKRFTKLIYRESRVKQMRKENWIVGEGGEGEKNFPVGNIHSYWKIAYFLLTCGFCVMS